MVQLKRKMTVLRFYFPFPCSWLSKYLIIKWQIWYWKIGIEILPIAPQFLTYFLTNIWNCKNKSSVRKWNHSRHSEWTELFNSKQFKLHSHWLLVIKNYVKDGFYPGITKASRFILSTILISKMLILFCWLVSRYVFSLSNKMLKAAGSQSFVVRL